MIGRLTRDPEMKYFESGSIKTTCSIALDRYKGKDKEKGVDYFDCEAWGKTAEILGEHFKQGKQIGITGNLEQSRWEDDAGNKRSRVFINIEEITFVGKKDDGESSGTASGGKNSGGSKSKKNDDEVPF
jgi:single-strand DNA-binding protein